MQASRQLHLMEKAPSGLHDFCEGLLDKYVTKDLKILDIASGTGAMSRRLIKNGYQNIVANDIDAASFAAQEVRFTSVDLNKDFSNMFGVNTFDVIVAIEIIEHLENPIAFVKECNKVLKPDGYLLLTTPNVLGTESIMQLLTRRELLYFSSECYDKLGHISVLPDWLLCKHITKSGFKIIFQGYSPRLLLRAASINPSKILGCLLLKTLDLIALCLGRSKSETVGTNYVVLARKDRAI